jgi:dipeptidyl aminopeptidase/acylaminoacyl peptidase
MVNTIIKLLFLLVISTTLLAKEVQFNTNELIILKGKEESLSSDEGYLLLSLETYDHIGELVIKPTGSGKKLKFKGVFIGENFALIKLKAGEYYWDKIKYYFLLGSMPFNYKKSDFTFKVEAGVINYPGTWYANLNFTGIDSAALPFKAVNKLSYELGKLRKVHNDLYQKYPFKYQGAIKDNYPEFFKHVSKLFPEQTSENAIEKHLSSFEKKKQKYVFYDKSDGIDAETEKFKNVENYLKDSSQSIGNFSPNGKFLLYSTVEEKVTRIEVLNISTYTSFVVFRNVLPQYSYLKDIKWVDNDSIYYQVQMSTGAALNKVVHLNINSEYKLLDAYHFDLPISGHLVDPLLNQQNIMYFASGSIYSKKKNGLYRIDSSTKKTIKKTTKKPYKKVKKLKNSVYWLTDSDSEIRFIITADYNKKDEIILDYWFLQENKDWIKIKTLTSIDDIELPQYISKDKKYFYVITNKYGDKSSIQMYSTQDFSHVGEFYSNNDIEIVGLKTDPSTDEIIGVAYVDNGFYKFKYFESGNDVLKDLREKLPNFKLFSIHNNTNTHNVLIFGVNEYTKGFWSIYNTKNKEYIKLFEVDPEYNTLKKGRFHNLKIESFDGVSIEGYLVMPENVNATKAPLIVIPHGGPIGVRDYAHDNEVQHFYASQGYATLKVNYRGSGGYGKQFEESGQMQWGEKIESDINQVVDHVLKNFPISENKICSMGSSYGGYSAIMLTILYPDRYKCAVSLAGVMDIPLLFTSSDFKEDESLFEKMSSIAGNPLVNYQGLVNKSPVYLIDKITRPILLFHGIYDKRVSIEHSLRMKEILDLAKLESSLIVLKNEGHSLNNKESKVVYLARSLEYIQKHLTDFK